MKKLAICLCALGIVFTMACVNDPEKHTESEVNPELSDTVKTKRDNTDVSPSSDTTSKTNDSVSTNTPK